jgi:hypothetical protein
MASIETAGMERRWWAGNGAAKRLCAVGKIERYFSLQYSREKHTVVYYL